MNLTSQLAESLGNDISFDQIMALDGEIFRQVADRRTLRFVAGGKGYFIKIHKGVGWKEIFKNLVQGRLPVLGAKNEYRAIKRLTEVGVETMTLAGYGCRGVNPARLESFVITDELPETITLEDFCRDWPEKPPPLSLKRALISRIAHIAKALHENGINHRDFYICHFNIQTESAARGELQLYLMDLHRAQIRRRTPIRWIVKDIAGLYFSTMDIGLTQHDFLRFIRIYRGQSLRQTLKDERKFWSRVQKKADKLYVKYQIMVERLTQAASS